MSSASAVAKGWALTIATAAYGYAGTQSSVIVALLGIVAVFLFFTIDVYYLKEERKYRLLFDAARRGEVDIYEMNATRYCNSLPRLQRKPLRWGRVAWSWSVRYYYAVMLMVGLLLVWWLQSR